MAYDKEKKEFELSIGKKPHAVFIGVMGCTCDVTKELTIRSAVGSIHTIYTCITCGNSYILNLDNLEGENETL